MPMKSADVEQFKLIAKRAGLEVKGYCKQWLAHDSCGIDIRYDTTCETLADLVEACEGDPTDRKILIDFLRGAIMEDAGYGNVIYCPAARWNDEQEDDTK